MAEKTKSQRIRMRLYKHPVKHDGTITEWSEDGSWFVVEFDGPVPTTKFWRHSESLVTDQEPCQFTNGGTYLASGAKLWEVL